MTLDPRILMTFPGLQGTRHRQTSLPEVSYNCIAWAAGDTTQWWWPFAVVGKPCFWPPSAQKTNTIQAFIDAFACLGYVPCSSASLEAGIEKVALYATNGEPQHAARQLGSGAWTSKLGQAEDIEHELHALAGAVYGQVAKILSRARP